mmetsp:Transcript_15928/g.38275  ORF Transcript_15928/g.38275 Transcript_15928/m.38275 type:complete len:316 (-) Transcript_15928:43-990(-)
MQSPTYRTQSERTSLARASAPQIEPSFSDARLKSFTIHSIIAPTPSANCLMRFERRRQRHALDTRSFMAPRAIPSLKFCIASDTCDISSAKSRMVVNMPSQTAPFERRPSKASFPELMTVKRLTASIPSTRDRSSPQLRSRSGRSGSPSVPPFSIVRSNLSSMRSSMMSGRVSIPCSMASIMSCDFSTHWSAKSPSSPASFVASRILSPSTKSLMISNLDASRPPPPSSVVIPSRVSFISIPKDTTSEALSIVEWQSLEVSREVAWTAPPAAFIPFTSIITGMSTLSSMNSMTSPAASLTDPLRESILSMNPMMA